MVERLVPETREWERMSAEHLSRYAFAIPWCRGKHTADVACGSGYGSCLLADSGALAVTGVDISSWAVRYCREKYRRPNLSFELQDGANLESFEKVFDVVVSFETIEHVTDARAFLSSLHAVLAPGGVLLVSTPRRKKEGRPDNEFHVREFSADEFRALLKEFFAEIELYGQVLLPRKNAAPAGTATAADAPVPVGRPASLLRRLKDLLLPLLFAVGIFKHRQKQVEDFRFLKEEFSDCDVLMAVCRRKPAPLREPG